MSYTAAQMLLVVLKEVEEEEEEEEGKFIVPMVRGPQLAGYRV